jgi:SAM-dependent methyltransferase
MAIPFGEHARRAARAYGAAADHYGLAPLGFWDRFGAETVSRLRLKPGQAVLDLCCGAGASAIPSARAVGPTGRVLGIDVAEPLLELARPEPPARAWPLPSSATATPPAPDWPAAASTRSCASSGCSSPRT